MSKAANRTSVPSLQFLGSFRITLRAQVGCSSRSGRINTIANQITITLERQAKFAFSQPHVYGGAQMEVEVKKVSETEITGVESPKGRTVAVNIGPNFEQLLRELPFSHEIDIRTYGNNIEQDTALGGVDAFVMDRVSSAQVFKESPLPLALAGKRFSNIQNARPFRNDAMGRPYLTGLTRL